MGYTRLTYLEPICHQLTQALGLEKDYRVAASIVDAEPLMVHEWCIVKVQQDGSIQPLDGERYRTIRDMLRAGRCEITSTQIAEAMSHRRMKTSNNIDKRIER